MTLHIVHITTDEAETFTGIGFQKTVIGSNRIRELRIDTSDREILENFFPCLSGRPC
jgi:hypothetical protein